MQESVFRNGLFQYVLILWTYSRFMIGSSNQIEKIIDGLFDNLDKNFALYLFNEDIMM